MHRIELSETVYLKAEQLAASRGFLTVEAFLSDVVREESVEEPTNYDYLFTPEVMAAIEEGLADVQAGRVSSLEEVKRHFVSKSEAWRKNQTG